MDSEETTHLFRSSRAVRRCALTRVLALAIVGVVSSLYACGNNGNGSNLSTGSSGDSLTEPPSSTLVDPNEVLAQCLTDRGLEVRRSGEIDGVPNRGVDYSAMDQNDPTVANAIAQCEELARTAIADAVGEMPSEEASRIGFDAYLSAFYSCMEEEGFHPRTVPPTDGEFEGSGAITEYAPGETLDPNFQQSEQKCIEVGHSAEAAVHAEIDG